MNHPKQDYRSIRPFLSDWAGMRHLGGPAKGEGLARMHLELLSVLSRKRWMDLFEISSLLNIGHLSVAEMVDALMERGLVQGKSRGETFEVSLGESQRGRRSGFEHVKNIIHREKSGDLALLSPKSLQRTRK